MFVNSSFIVFRVIVVFSVRFMSFSACVVLALCCVFSLFCFLLRVALRVVVTCFACSWRCHDFLALSRVVCRFGSDVRVFCCMEPRKTKRKTVVKQPNLANPILTNPCLANVFVLLCVVVCCCVLLCVVVCCCVLFRRLRGRRGFTRQPENSKRAHLRAGLRKHHQNSTRRHPERETKRAKTGAGEGKNSATFWVSTLRGPIFSGFLGPHHDTQPDPEVDWPKMDLAKIGQAKTKMANNGLDKSGQIRMAKTGLAKVGLFQNCCTGPQTPVLPKQDCG